MTLLHLEIGVSGEGFFSADSPLPVDTVRSVVWFPDEAQPVDGGRVMTSARNLLMFLSDVRTRRFKRGMFLGEDILQMAAEFRQAAQLVAAGRYLPGLEERADGFHAVWRPLQKSAGQPARHIGTLLDALVRRAGRTPLEGDTGKHETVHDAWLAALRSDSGRVCWQSDADIRALMEQLRAWYAPLVVSPADRAALTFALVPPASESGLWRLTLAAPPATRLGLVSLGQAAAICPSLRGLLGGSADMSRTDAENFLRTDAAALASTGYSVVLPDGVSGEHLSAEAELETVDAASGRQTAASRDETARPISRKLTIRVDGEVVGEDEINFLLDQGSSLVFFRNRWIEVDRNVLREALRALRATTAKKLSVREAVSFALGFGRIGRMRVDRVKARGWIRGLLNELRGKDAFTLLPAPAGLHGTLRDYQLRGLSWLVFLSRWGFGPCLADDMGLGKTIQAIAFMLHLRAEAAGGGSPALVVAPVSVTTNWVREINRFAPGLKVLLHQGANRFQGGSFRQACAHADVVVAGYSLFVKDFREFSEAAFSALILDEAQTIKNPDTRAARAARALDVPVRIAMTGTPLENSANDLWALQEFLNPGLLGERKAFEETFTRAIREDAHSGAAARLKHILEPFMLRRLKTDPAIAAELGTKREIREYCTLSGSQRMRYEEALSAYRADMAADGGNAPSRGRMLALITELKLVCDGDGKLERLDDLLSDIFANGESCLIFTQYAKVGRMLQEHLLEEFGSKFPFLHGGLSPARRDEEIAAFNGSPEPCAFILSLKAGGFGLNLTKATHVIHFDRWWNPAVENQATDRAHRIGQTKTVFVHMFICAGTLEDHIDELLSAKRQLAAEVVTGGEAFILKMGAREFERTVALS